MALDLDLWRDRHNPRSRRALLDQIETAVHKLGHKYAFMSKLDAADLEQIARISADKSFDDFDPSIKRALLFPFVYQRMEWALMAATKNQKGIVRIPINLWLKGKRPRRAYSLSDPIKGKEKEAERHVDRLVDPSNSPLDAIMEAETAAVLNEALQKLDPRCAHILRRRSEGIYLAEIGRELGLSRERARQLEVIGLQKMRVFVSKMLG